MTTTSGYGRRVGDAWQTLSDRCIRGERDRSLTVWDDNRRAPAWPTSQVIAAAIARTPLVNDGWDEVDRLTNGLRDFWVGDAYCDMPRRALRRGHRYYDDNAWVALNLLQAAILKSQGDPAVSVAEEFSSARRILAFLQGGEDHERGGIWWRVGYDSRNACSTAPSGLVALRVVEVERALDIEGSDHSELVSFALRCAQFVESLTQSDGLVADNVNNRGEVELTRHSYNQGTALGLHLQLARITGDGVYLGKARKIAEAVQETFTGDRLWREPPCFVAILLRHLLALGAVDRDPRWSAFASDWLNRVEEQGRDPNTGFYIAGGIGHYDGSVSLDQAGVAQVQFLLDWPDDMRQWIC